MIRRIVPQASFELFDVNSRGKEPGEYGLTSIAIERANNYADLIIVGGSNLYEGGFRWPWGVHLDTSALECLRVPLFLMGIGTGSNFDSSLHEPSRRARTEIKLLNQWATLSGVRDLTTLEWLQRLGVSKAKLLGDPATFIFNFPLREQESGGHVLITIPPHRVWSSKRGLWKARRFGRPIFEALVNLARTLVENGEQVVVACNDPHELPLASRLFDCWLPRPVICPEDTQDYCEILSQSRVVVSGRLHTAAVAFSLGIPFLLIDLDHRTRGFLETYHLAHASVAPSRRNMGRLLKEHTNALLGDSGRADWHFSIKRRDQLYSVAMHELEAALKSVVLKENRGLQY